jgi:uncharacterized membrane protein
LIDPDPFKPVSPVTREREVHAGRVFAFTLAGAFLVLGLLARHSRREYVATTSFGLALIFFLAGIVVPGRLGPLRRAWMKIGETIGLVTTPLFLGVVYYLLLSPVAFVRRARRGDRSTSKSGWLHREALPPRDRMERQF